MPWIIDRDLLAEKEQQPAQPGTNSNAKGLTGPRNYAGTGQELTHRFRMKDGDGEVYYEGRSSDDSDFGPLDNFGQPNAGCTDIEYFQNGKGGGWKPL